MQLKYNRLSLLMDSGSAILWLLLTFCSCYSAAYADSISPIDSTASNDAMFWKPDSVIVMIPNVKINVGKKRPPIVDFLEAEMTASVDNELFEMLLETLKDTSRIIPAERRNPALYSDENSASVSSAIGCEKLGGSQTFSADYSFVNMPIIYFNEPRGHGQVSELHAVFSIYDCASGQIVWKNSETVFVPMKNASYKELMRKMYDQVLKEIPYK